MHQQYPKCYKKALLFFLFETKILVEKQKLLTGTKNHES